MARSLTRSLLLAASVFLLFGCATNKNAVTQDYRAGASFSDLRTYSVAPAVVQIQGLVEPQHISHLVDQQLGLRNFYKTADGADMHVNTQVFSRTTQGASTGIGIGLGVPIGRHGGVSLGTGQLLEGRNKTVAVIVIDITRTHTNELIWRGTADAVPLDYFTLANEAKLADTIAQVLAQFPPK